MLLHIAFYIGVLEPVNILSLSLQKKEVDPVNSSNALLKTKSKFIKLEQKPVDLYPSIAYLTRNITENDDGNSVFKGLFKIKSLANEISDLNEKKSNELKNVKKEIYNRLENDEEGFLNHITLILNTEGWLKKDEDGCDDIEFANKEVLELYNRFLEPLKRAGLDCSEVDLLSEWHELISHANNNLSSATISYLKTWRRIFISSKCREDFKNILLLIEICFCLPCSNAQLERAFSQMKRVKTSGRCSLGSERLEHLVRIGEEGVEFEKFDATPYVNAWWKQKFEGQINGKKKEVTKNGLLKAVPMNH